MTDFPIFFCFSFFFFFFSFALQCLTQNVLEIGNVNRGPPPEIQDGKNIQIPLESTIYLEF